MSNKGDSLADTIRTLSAGIIRCDNADTGDIKVKQEGDSLADTIWKLSASCDSTATGDIKLKQEVIIGEPRTGKHDKKKMGVACGSWGLLGR